MEETVAMFGAIGAIKDCGAESDPCFSRWRCTVVHYGNIMVVRGLFVASALGVLRIRLRGIDDKVKFHTREILEPECP